MRRDMTLVAPQGVTLFPQAGAYYEEYLRWLRKRCQPLWRFKCQSIASQIYFVLFDMLKMAIESTEMYGERATIPVMHLSLREVARKVYRTYSEQPLPEPRAGQEPRRPTRQFIFSGIPTDLKAGGEFEWCEFALEILMRKLPKALEDLAAGILPEDFTVYVMGYPTKRYSKIGSVFLYRLKREGMPFFAQSYTHYIEQIIAELPTDSTVELKGISLGGSIAAEVASQLKTKNKVHQVGEGSVTPYLEVYLYSPVAMYELNTVVRKARMARLAMLALAAELGLHGFQPGVKRLRHEMPDFLKHVDDAHGYDLNAEDPQRTLKKKVLDQLWKLGRRGIPMPTNVRTHIIVGKWDAMIWRKTNNGKKLKLEHCRLVMVNAPHQFPFYRKRVWEIFDRVNSAIALLSQEK